MHGADRLSTAENDYTDLNSPDDAQFLRAYRALSSADLGALPRERRGEWANRYARLNPWVGDSARRQTSTLFSIHSNSAAQPAPSDWTAIPLVPIDSHDLVEREFPPLERMLTPWLAEKSLNMVHAWRGVGKTWFSLGVSVAVASGGDFLNWRAPKPRKVLFIDGEMAAQQFQERLIECMRAADATPPRGFLTIVTPDLQDRAMPDFATADGQYYADQLVEEDTALIVLDNLSSLVRRGGAENDAESWLQVSEWALRHRRAGRAILFIHHSGKGGAQRGTSKREDLLDVVINLRRPKDSSEQDGAVFELHFEKARTLYGDDVAPFEARLTSDQNGKNAWTLRALENVTGNQICELWDLGLSVTDIAHEVGRHKSNVSRCLQKAQQDEKLKRPFEARRGHK